MEIIDEVYAYVLKLSGFFGEKDISIYYITNTSIHVYSFPKYKMVIYKEYDGDFRVVYDKIDEIVGQEDCLDHIFLFMTKE